MAFIDPDSHPAMLRHGLKTGTAAVLAFGLASLFNLKYGYWAALSAVIVMQVYVADSVQMCLYRFSGTAVGALIGMAAISVFPATQAMTVLALFLSVAFCAYMTRYNARYRMAAITVCIVILASLDQEDRLVFGLLRVAEIGIGVAAAALPAHAATPATKLDPRLAPLLAWLKDGGTRSFRFDSSGQGYTTTLRLRLGNSGKGMRPGQSGFDEYCLWHAGHTEEKGSDVNLATWLLLLWPFAFYLYGAVYSDAVFLLGPAVAGLVIAAGGNCSSTIAS